MSKSDNLWAKLIARTWDDEGLRAKLLSDPTTVMRAHGMDIPPGVTVKVVPNTETVMHFALPMKPTARDLSEEQLGAVTGGNQTCCCATVIKKVK
jgi:hypothetical protein